MLDAHRAASTYTVQDTYSKAYKVIIGLQETSTKTFGSRHTGAGAERTYDPRTITLA